MTLEEKIGSAQKGDDNAFYELINERKALLYKTAYSYVKNKEDALDIVNETVFKSYCSIKKLKEPKFFNTWLTRILINCSLDAIRKNKKLVPFEEKLGSDKISETDSNEEMLDLKKSIEKLDDKCRTVVILKYYQDMTISEISEVLECPAGTIKTYLHRALTELRIDLKEDDI